MSVEMAGRAGRSRRGKESARGRDHSLEGAACRGPTQECQGGGKEQGEVAGKGRAPQCGHLCPVLMAVMFDVSKRRTHIVS